MRTTTTPVTATQECALCGGPVRRWVTTAFDPRLRAVPVSRTRCLACGWERTVAPVGRPRGAQPGWAVPPLPTPPTED